MNPATKVVKSTVGEMPSTVLAPAYKRTEARAIPIDWSVASLAEIAQFASGDCISVARLSRRSSDCQVPVFGGNGIAGYTEQAMVFEPTVVLGRVGQKCGVVYRTEGPAWITDNALYPRRFTRPVDVGFLALALQQARLNDVRNRNDLPLITQGILRNVKVLWPRSLLEQRAIAGTLSDVDALIGALDKLIAKKRLCSRTWTPRSPPWNGVVTRPRRSSRG